MPLTKCSSASSSMSGLAARLTALCVARALGRCGAGGGCLALALAAVGLGVGLLGLGGLGLGVRLLGLSVGLLGLSRVLLSLGRLSLGRTLAGVGLVGLLGPGGVLVGPGRVGLPGPAAALRAGGGGVVLGRFLQRRGEHLLLVRRGFGGTQRAFRAGLAPELLPVARALQSVHDRRRGLRAHGQPMLFPLRVDLDERRLFLRVVLADLLDGTPVALGASVGNDDAVRRHPGPAQALELDLYSHGCGLLPANQVRAAGRRPGGDWRYRSDWPARRGKRAPRAR